MMNLSVWFGRDDRLYKPARASRMHETNEDTRSGTYWHVCLNIDPASGSMLTPGTWPPAGHDNLRSFSVPLLLALLWNPAAVLGTGTAMALGNLVSTESSRLGRLVRCRRVDGVRFWGCERSGG